MSNVYLFGAGASCEYKAKLPGTLFSAKFRDGFFLDCNFFEFVDVTWEEWFKGGAQPPDDYYGSEWSWPDLEGLLEQTCGPSDSNNATPRSGTWAFIKKHSSSDASN